MYVEYKQKMTFRYAQFGFESLLFGVWKIKYNNLG